MEFKKILFTAPDFRADEAKIISLLLDRDAIDIVHIRKPGATQDEISRLIESLPTHLHSRLKLHSHFSLVERFNLRGAHLNSRCPEAPGNCGLLSRSCHSLEEVQLISDEYEYVTLSPVFDSISKPGYRAAFSISESQSESNLQRLNRNNLSTNVIALGGIEPKHFPLLREAGFAGAAMLGFIWENPSPIDKVINDLLCYNTSQTLNADEASKSR